MRKVKLLVGLADMAYAFRHLRPDPEGAERIARVLGFEMVEPAEQDSTPRLSFSDNELELGEAKTPEGLRISSQLREEPPTGELNIPLEVRQLTKPKSAIGLPKRIRKSQPLPENAQSAFNIPPPSPLLIRRLLRAFLIDAVGDDLPDESIDVDEAVERIACYQLDRPLPRRRRRGFRSGLQLWIDESPAMQPYRHDVEYMRAAVRRIVGPSYEGEFFIDRLPLDKEGVSPHGEPAGDVKLRTGIKILLLTDLGIGRPPLKPRLSSDQWHSFARTMATRDARVVALVPYGPSRWPKKLRKWMKIVQWHSSHPQPLGSSKEQVRSLAQSLSIASQIDPALLREARRSLLPNSDAGLEADFLFSTLVSVSNPRAVALRKEILSDLRTELAHKPDELQRAFNFLRSYRERVSSNFRINFEEELVFQCLRQDFRDLRRIRESLSRVVHSLVESEGDSSLARWVLSCLPELPEWIHGLSEAQYLRTAAELRLGLDPTDFDLGRFKGHNFWLLPKPTNVGIRLRGSSLEFHEPPESDEPVIEVPATNPRVIFVEAVQGTRAAAQFESGQPSAVKITALPIELETLAGARFQIKGHSQAVHYTTAKIVLLGDSGVGKTGLGWKLAHGEYKEHSATHGQQFWVIDQLTTRRDDGTECEAILWDLAGQPYYRLTHALFLADADLALILFDPCDSRDPLRGIDFWLHQLRAERPPRHAGQQMGWRDAGPPCPTILVGARADRGEARLTQEELDDFCRQRGITGGYLATSAKENIGLDELLRRMRDQISWNQKTKTVTTFTVKRIKDFVLGLKENRHRKNIIVKPHDLRKLMEKTDKEWKFSDAEMMTAVGHLANYGYVSVLQTSKGEERILLRPELLNNLAASFVLEARRNPKGLGSLEESRLLAGEYKFPELEKLSEEERNILLDSAGLLFLHHNVCFRETDLGGNSYLVFPELINLKKPLLDDEQTEDGVAYTVSGAVENVYALLVVLLGYTRTFTRTNQWQNQARYVMEDDSICGFRQEGEREGELDLVLYFGTNVGRPVKTLFQGLFESFLARRNLSVFRYEPVICSNGHALNRAVVRERLSEGRTLAFCFECGEKLTLPKADEPIQLTQTERRKVEEQQRFAARRSRFEQAVFQVMSYVEDQKQPKPECFISYAWGNKKQERWVERDLATDLQKAGITVVLDKWENTRVGASVARFVERIAQCDKVIVVGTPAYKKKYANKDTGTGVIVAVEEDLINLLMLRTEADRESVLPVLLAGNDRESFPIWLQGRVYADFRDDRAYFTTAFDLILSLYGISHGNPAVADLRESLKESEM